MSRVFGFAPYFFASAMLASVALAEAAGEPITFEHTDIGAASDPLGLFSDEDVQEGGSVVQPSVWYATLPVDGGAVEISILADAWCSTSECPFRFRVRDAAGRVVQTGFPAPTTGMICQSFMDEGQITYDPVALTVKACSRMIDLKEAS